ncbi:MAG: Rrf2 family transcriptional regulator [Verrucomicrobia bacterium]|nr:Rrf2 family transcriptional regulator [Verrucomicrobiota bacterium]
MKLSKKGEYALRALIDLGIADQVGRSLVQVGELAEKEQIPVKFLEQIMQLLKEEGFIQSQRGKFGGYRLARAANKITIGSIVRLIDGPLAPIGCVSHTAYEKCSCPDETHCGLRMLMLDVRNAIAGILDRYSLADVVEVTLRKMRRDNVPLPFSEARTPGQAARKQSVRSSSRPDLQPVEGILSNLFPDYTI